MQRELFKTMPRVWIVRYEDKETWCTSGEQTKEEAIKEAEERRLGHKVVAII